MKIIYKILCKLGFHDYTLIEESEASIPDFNDRKWTDLLNFKNYLKISIIRIEIILMAAENISLSHAWTNIQSI